MCRLVNNLCEFKTSLHKQRFEYSIDYFQVKDVDETNITLSTLDPNGIQVLTRTDLVAGVPIKIGISQWVPFVIQLPPQVITKAQVTIV